MRAEIEDLSRISQSEYALAASFWIIIVKSDIDSPDFCFREDMDERRMPVSVASGLDFCSGVREIDFNRRYILLSWISDRR